MPFDDDNTFFSSADSIRKATSYRLCVCCDPHCGPHIVAMDENNEPICQLVFDIDKALLFIDKLQHLIVDKLSGSPNATAPKPN